MLKGHGEQLARIQSIPLFAELDDEQLATLDATLSEAFVDAGKSLTVQGQVGREFSIILEGLATVIRDGIQVERLGPGSFFGEHALLCGDPRTADVVALTPMRLLVAGPSEFARMRREIPSFDEQVNAADQQRQRITQTIAPR